MNAVGTAPALLAGARRRVWRRWLLTAGRVRAGELAGVLVVLGLVAALVFGSHVRDGGFYSDDWANRARTHLAGGYGNALQSFWDLTGYRPVLAFYVPTLHEVLGHSATAHLAWATFLGVAMSIALYALLVETGVARLHAGVVAALVLVFPFSDSTRFWATSSSSHLTAVLWMSGLCVALRALEPGRARRSALVLHGVSLALYLTSLLLYELPATLMVAGGALYVARAGWRRGAARWGTDLLVVMPALGYIAFTTDIDTATGGTGAVEHARLILDQGWQILASAAWPLGAPERSIVTAVVAAVLAAGALVALRSPAGPDRDALRRWLVLAGGGFVAAWTAWAVFVPGHPYYSPGTAGVGNRVNTLAAMGIVLFLYATAVVAATLLARAVRAPQALAAPVACAAVVAALGVGYVDRVLEDKRYWDGAARAQDAVLAGLRSALADPRPGSVIWTFGHAAWQAPGVPVFSASWDLDGAVKLLYDDPTLRGYPALPLTTFECRADGLTPRAGYGDLEFAYGTVYFVDVASRRVDAVTDAADCRAAAAEFRPGQN